MSDKVKRVVLITVVALLILALVLPLTIGY